MKKYVFIFTLICIGCVNESTNDTAYNSDLSLCTTVNKIGNLTSLFKDLENHEMRVRELLNSTNNFDENDRIELHQHAIEIEKIGEKVTKLSDPIYTTIDQDYHALWNLRPNLLKSKVGVYLPNGFQFYDADIEEVYYLGVKREDFKNNFHIKINQDENGNSIQIEYEDKTSWLFKCQLKKTMLARVKIFARNLIFKKYYYVNLLID